VGVGRVVSWPGGRRVSGKLPGPGRQRVGDAGVLRVLL